MLNDSTSWIKILLQEPIVSSSKMDQCQVVQLGARVTEAVASSVQILSSGEQSWQQCSWHRAESAAAQRLGDNTKPSSS